MQDPSDRPPIIRSPIAGPPGLARQSTPLPKKKGEALAGDGQACQKCGAMFFWERVHIEDPTSPLSLKLIEPSHKCDCGYGKSRRTWKRQ